MWLSYRKVFIYAAASRTSHSMHQRKAEMRPCLVCHGLNCASAKFPALKAGWVHYLERLIRCQALILAKQEYIFRGNAFSHKYFLLKVETTISIRIKKKLKLKWVKRAWPPLSRKKSWPGCWANQFLNLGNTYRENIADVVSCSAGETCFQQHHILQSECQSSEISWDLIFAIFSIFSIIPGI